MQKSFLFHPKVTLAAVIAAITSLGTSCTAMVAALDPLLKLKILAPYYDLIKHIDGELVATGVILMAVAAVLTALAGAGRSFVSAVDAGGSK